MKFYTPSQWYWLVGGDNARAYSSAVGDYVPADDAAFVEWQSGGTLPSTINSVADLGGVLAPYKLKPVAADVLAAYNEALKGIAPVVIASGSVTVQGTTATLAGQSFNIASMVRQSMGVFRFTFIKPAVDAGYTAMISCAKALAELADPATDAFTINTVKANTENPFDPKTFDFQIFDK